MTQTTNAHLVPAATPYSSGDLLIDRQVTNLASPGYWPATIAIGDQIQIGVVPQGAVLVPWLCNLNLPVIDSGPAGTLQGQIGTAATPAALKAATAMEAAQNIPGSAFSPTAVIGDPVNPVPIFITATAAAVAAAQTGRIVFDLAYRPWRDDTDLGYETP